MWTEAKTGINYREGDVIRLGPVLTHADRTDTTSSTTYEAKKNLGFAIINWSTLGIPLDELQVAFRGTISPGTDETASIRLFEPGFSNVIIEESRSAFDRIHTDWQSYSPNNPNAALRIRVEVKTSNGVNPSEFRAPELELGVKIG